MEEMHKHVLTKEDLTRELSRAVQEVRDEANKKWHTWMGLSVGVIAMLAAIIAAVSTSV